jgi:glutamine synthetase
MTTIADSVRVNVEYLWLDAKHHTRSKMRTLYLSHDEAADISLDDPASALRVIPRWEFDGGATGQATAGGRECVLEPVHAIRHPFPLRPLSIPTWLVMCELRIGSGRIHPTDTRAMTRHSFENSAVIRDQRALFSAEQEFFFFDKATKAPHGWTIKSTLPRDEYYCGVNRSLKVEREIINELYEKCLACDIPICEASQEVSPAQWKYRIGPAPAPLIGDLLYFAKFILFRLCERHDLYPAFNPKPIKGDWNGSGCHFTISTRHTRHSVKDPADSSRFSCGSARIREITDKMSDNHEDFMRSTGSKNIERLTGTHNTSNFRTFSIGINTKSASVAIDSSGRGLEDRRPGANVDYYTILSLYARYLV